VKFSSCLPIGAIRAHNPSGEKYLGGAMTCRETVRLICEYLEGRLSPSVAAVVTGHIDRCSNCHLVLQAAQQTLDAYFDGHPETSKIRVVA
jgi:Putative zinc-finger